MQSAQYPILVSAPQIPQGVQQPHPRFCILRPGGLWTPLIPLDEMPSWLIFRSLAQDIQIGLHPVSMSYIPREKEYEISCHNCSESVDLLHRNAPEPVARVVAGQSQTTPSLVGSTSSEQTMTPSPPIAPVALAYHMPLLSQPHLATMLPAPFVGMCLVDMQSRQPSSAGSAGRRMSMENISPSNSPEPLKEGLQSTADPCSPTKGFCASCSGAASTTSEKIRKWDISEHWRCGSLCQHVHCVESPDRPKHADSMCNISCVATRPLTAAAIQASRMRARSLDRGSPQYPASSAASTVNGGSTVSISNVSKISKISKVSMASKVSKASKASKISRASKLSRASKISIASKLSMASKISSKVVLSRRERRILKLQMRLYRMLAESSTSKTPSSPKSPVSLPEPKEKPEQQNSVTKRRDRRERMKRGRKQSDRGKQPYYNKMRNPNWKPGMSKH